MGCLGGVDEVVTETSCRFCTAWVMLMDGFDIECVDMEKNNHFIDTY